MKYFYPGSALWVAGFVLLMGCGSIARASDLSLSSAVVNPGGTATLSLNLTVSGTAPAGLEWKISYLRTQISAISITQGPATSQAKKALTCALGSGTATCIVTGMNTTSLASGVVANITATIAPGITSASIQISNLTGARIGRRRQYNRHDRTRYHFRFHSDIQPDRRRPTWKRFEHYLRKQRVD
jgi:hypothetical protein